MPSEFWNDDAVRTALVEQHMGRVIRAYRHHPIHGRHPLPQDLVGSWFGLSQAQLSRIENGAPIVHLDRLIQWATALGIPQQHLWFRLPDAARPESGYQHVERRTFLAVTGAGLAGVLAPAAAAAPSRPAEVPTNAVAAAMFGPTIGSEPATTTELTRQVVTAWRLRQRSDYVALGQVVPSLITRAEHSAAALAGIDRELAARAAVHAYNAASSLLRRLGDGPLALLAADRAVRGAGVLGDPLLHAAALYRLANVLLSARRLDDARTVALQAAIQVEPGRTYTPRLVAMWGGLLLTAAVAAARMGDRAAAWELMGEARVGSRLLGADHADLYSIFGPTNVAIHGVQVAVELRDGRDAVRRGRVVDPDRLPSSLVERRSQYLVHLAHGHVLERDDVAAVATLVRAERLAPQEVRLSTDVGTLVQTMLGRERVGAVAELRPLAARIGMLG